MLIAIPEAVVLEAPELMRSLAADVCVHGGEVLCVTEHFDAQARAVLGSRVGYVGVDVSLTVDAVWIKRAGDQG